MAFTLRLTPEEMACLEYVKNRNELKTDSSAIKMLLKEYEFNVHYISSLKEQISELEESRKRFRRVIELEDEIIRIKRDESTPF